MAISHTPRSFFSFFSVLFVLTHAVATAFSLVAFGTLHSLSGNGIWGVMLSSYQVRQFSVYLVDFSVFYGIAILFCHAAVLRFIKPKKQNVLLFSFVGLAASIVAVVAHLPFYPTSLRAFIIVIVFGQLQVMTFGFLRELFMRRGSPVRLRLKSSLGFVLVTAIISSLYLAIFSPFGGTHQEEIYRPAMEPTPVENVAETQDIFSVVPLDGEVFGRAIGMSDLDGNGQLDVLIHGKNRHLETWLNNGDRFEKTEFLPQEITQIRVGNFSFADLNGDGRDDLILGDRGDGSESDFRRGFLKKLIFYPGREPSEIGRVFLRQPGGGWKEETSALFPDGTLTMYRKIEPMLLFDVNGDGRLDLVFSGYPTPTTSENKFYIQNDNGTFSESMDDLFDLKNKRIYPEGSDVADIDFDGDLDGYFNGYLMENRDGRFITQCDETFAWFKCDMPERNDEGVLIEDIDGDGNFDFLVSYHGVGGSMPKYRLQFFMGSPGDPWAFSRRSEISSLFYGFNSYLRAKDVDGDGGVEILTQDPGRLLSVKDDTLVDLLPALNALAGGDLEPLGWLDAEDDGDWDFLARRKKDNSLFLARNNSNPSRVLRLSVVGKNGVENQAGTSLALNMASGKSKAFAYRPIAGYRGVADPRLFVALKAEKEFDLKACFASLDGQPKNISVEGINIEVLRVDGRCIDYRITIGDADGKIDLTLYASEITAKVTMH